MMDQQEQDLRQAMRLLRDGTRALRSMMIEQRRSRPSVAPLVTTELSEDPPPVLRSDDGVVVVEVDRTNQTVTVTPSAGRPTSMPGRVSTPGGP